MTARNGDGPDGATGATKADRIVEQNSTRLIAAQSAKAQDDIIVSLAELFPVLSVAERWKPHRPLKLGIDRDLVDLGVLKPEECHGVFRRYCSRLMYQRSLAAGGARFDLDGNVAGEVTPEQAAGAKAVVTAIEAKRVAKAKAVADERNAARKADKTIKLLAPSKAPRKVQPAPFVEPAKLGLADLKAAARARREAAHG